MVPRLRLALAVPLIAPMTAPRLLCAPAGQEPNVFRDRLGLTNVMIAKLADGEHLHFLGLGERFLRPDGSISSDIMPDFLHLSSEGYRVLATALEPHLRALLGGEP